MSEKCEAGCVRFYGGEIRHHKDCFFYPDSRTEMYDQALSDIAALTKERDEARADHDLTRKWCGIWKARAIANVGEWQPIETAPKDGTLIELGWDAGFFTAVRCSCIGSWRGNWLFGKAWRSGRAAIIVNPKRWRPVCAALTNTDSEVK